MSPLYIGVYTENSFCSKCCAHDGSPVEHRTAEQIAFIEQLVNHDPTVAPAFTLTQAFGQLLRKREGKSRLEDWKAAVRSSGMTELIRFVEGLTDDEVAVTNACTEHWSNGMVEGFNQKVKLIKRSSYGQAGFPLLQRRVLLHPASQDSFGKDQKRLTTQRSASPDSRDASSTRAFPAVSRETRIA